MAQIKVNVAYGATGTLATANIADDAITAAKIADNAVVTAAINADAVTDAKIADDVIGTEHLTAGEVDTTALGADSVTAAKIGDNVLDSEHYAAASIDNEHLADNAADTAEIADNAITLAKMAGLARGKLIYGDASGDPAALAVGSNTQVLKSDGTDIAWGTDSGGAALTGSTNNTITTVTGADAIQGEANLTFDGSALTVTGTGTFAGHVTPSANDTYDLGSGSYVWRDIYTGDLNLTNQEKEKGNDIDGTKGSWKIQEGENDLFIMNKVTGKKFKFKLEEIV